MVSLVNLLALPSPLSTGDANSGSDMVSGDAEESPCKVCGTAVLHRATAASRFGKGVLCSECRNKKRKADQVARRAKGRCPASKVSDDPVMDFEQPVASIAAADRQVPLLWDMRPIGQCRPQDPLLTQAVLPQAVADIAEVQAETETFAEPDALAQAQAAVDLEPEPEPTDMEEHDGVHEDEHADDFAEVVYIFARSVDVPYLRFRIPILEEVVEETSSSPWKKRRVRQCGDDAAVKTLRF